MQTHKVLLYVKSSAVGAQQKAASYFEFFTQDPATKDVTVLRSTPRRTDDIASLRRWVQMLELNVLAELVVIGGDGSVNIAANACVDTKVRLSIIPAGTGNDFARALGITDWRWRMRTLPQLRRRSVGSIGEHIFINHAGAGISVALRDLQGPASKRWLKGYSYLWALLRYLFVRPSRRCEIIDTAGKRWEFQVAAVNRDIGGGITVYPGARLATEVLGVLQVPKLPRWRQLGALFWLLRKQPDRSRILACSEVRQFSLADTENWIELDGDAVELRGPATASVKVNALHVYTQGRKR
jgi:diacylglycerol kinase family enzyme